MSGSGSTSSPTRRISACCRTRGESLKGGQRPTQEVVAEVVSATLCKLYGFDGYLWARVRVRQALRGRWRRREGRGAGARRRASRPGRDPRPVGRARGAGRPRARHRVGGGTDGQDQDHERRAGQAPAPPRDRIPPRLHRGQAERGMGLQTQRDRVREHAAAKGYQLVSIVQEAASGGVQNGEEFSYEHRPVLLSLIARAEAGEYDVLLVAKLDRLSRDFPTLAVLERRLQRFGVEVVSATEENGDGPLAEFVRGQLALVAQLERAMILERVAAGRAKRKAQGRHVQGTAPTATAPRRQPAEAEHSSRSPTATPPPSTSSAESSTRRRPAAPLAGSPTSSTPTGSPARPASRGTARPSAT